MQIVPVWLLYEAGLRELNLSIFVTFFETSPPSSKQAKLESLFLKRYLLKINITGIFKKKATDSQI
jgi:hypothetical protein